MYLGFSMCMLSMSYSLNIYFPSWDCHVILLIIRVLCYKSPILKKGWSKFAGEVCILIVSWNLCFDRCVWKFDHQLNSTRIKTKDNSLFFPRKTFAPFIIFFTSWKARRCQIHVHKLFFFYIPKIFTSEQRTFPQFNSCPGLKVHCLMKKRNKMYLDIFTKISTCLDKYHIFLIPTKVT